MKKHTQIFGAFLSWGSEALWVACGGALGALARYGVEMLLPQHAVHPGFPWATFLINVSGAGLLGFVMAWVEEGEHPPHWLQAFAGIGFCGAFTTFSSASVEILLMARGGHIGLGATYLGASLAFGILAVTLTTTLGIHLFKNHNAGKAKVSA